MKLTRQDRQVINNFAKLNKNLEFKKDLKQQTSAKDRNGNNIAGNLLAEYTLQSDEFKSFLIYDTKEFLKVINCFNNPKVIINDDLITLKEFNNEFRYYTAEKSIMVLPNKTIDEVINGKIPDVSYELSFDDIKSIEYVKSEIKLPHIIFKTDEKNNNIIVLTDIHNKSSPEFTYTLDYKTNRKYSNRMSGFKEIELLVSNYKISIFENSFVLLESSDIPLKYLIALEPKPTPDSKEGEIINHYAENQKRNN